MAEELLAAPELYFMRRLGTVRRAQALTASMQFDLARSPLTDDQLDETVDSFDGNASATGFGFADMLKDLISREPHRIPVTDLKRLQENLIKQGYTPPGTEATGVWDPSWYAYARRWDRDNYEAVISGHHWGAVPLEAGFRAITNTLPSRVWQGLVGSAKGLITQAPETAERVGLVGGAAGGAAIGAVAGSVLPGPGTAIGAGIGAAVGGAIGFFSDLFGEDVGEEDQSTNERLIDALSPFEEYADQGWRAAWEDLGYIGAAASMIAGVGAAAKGAAAVVGGIRAAAPTVAEAAAGPGRLFVAGPTGTAVENVSGVVSPTLKAALMRPVGAEPGILGHIVTAATRKFAPGTAGWVEQQMIRYGPFANIQRPAFQVVTKAYSGLTAAQMGARLSAGFDLGTGAAGQTTLEKAIVETDPLQSGVELPLLGDMVDWAAFVMVPERFLPFRARDLGAAATRMMGETALRPFAHAFQFGTRLGLRKAVDLAQETVTPELNTYMRLDYGVHTEALALVQKTGIKGGYTTARAQVIRDLKAEVAELGPAEGIRELADKVIRGEATVDELPMVGRLMVPSLTRPERFEAWLIENAGRNRGVDLVTNYAEASKLARVVTRDVRAGRTLVTEHPEAFVASSSGLEVGGIRGQGFNRLALQKEADTLEAAIKRAERTQKRTMDPTMIERQGEAIRKSQERLRVVREELAKPSPPSAGEINVIPAREDFLTRGDLYRIRSDYLRLVDEVKSTWAGELDAAHTVARGKLRDLVQDLAAKGYIPDRLAREVVESGADPGRAVADSLEQAAQTAARDVRLPEQEMARWADLGYKPVATGEDVIQLHEIDTFAEAFGVGDYTRRAAVWETLGLSPRWVRDEDLFALRVAHERAELQQVFEELDIPLSGGQAITRLRQRLEEMNHEGVVIGPLVKPAVGRPRPYLVDVRQLTPEDVFSVFEDIGGFTDETAQVVYRALKRGAAYGGEAKLLPPVVLARSLGHAMRISGLPGFADFIRTAKLPVPPKTMAAIGGAAAGAATGALVGDEDFDIVKGAVGGALVGLGARYAAKKAYGYLPEKLSNLNMALRYTFSFTFDAGRYTEQNLLAAARAGLPPMLAPKRYIMAREWRSPYAKGTVTGEEAWRHVTQFQDELNGTRFFQHIDDTDRRMFQTGMLGYSPRNMEAARAFQLYQRGWSMDKIRETVSMFERYGLGRTAAEKTANFVMFPFSFSKKLLTSLGDFILQAPGRNLLLTEGLRRYHQSALDEGFRDLVENHVPLLEQVWQINNLAFGISPGRFFLEGIDDHRSAVGGVSQVLASVFVPSGAATPLAQAAGGVGDLALHAFVPVVITGESLDRAGGIDGFDDIMRRYVPFIREIDQYFVQGEGGKIFGGAVGEQLAAVTSPGFRAPYAQLTGYLDETRMFKSDLEPLALALGYSSADGLLASDLGAPMQARYDKLKEELREKYPSGWALVSQIDNTTLIDKAAMADLMKKDDQSPAEEAILNIAQQVEVLRAMNTDLGIPSDIGGSLITANVRKVAYRYMDDPRFAELYDRFFAREYGPIRVIAA